jgi:hypothetical protein
MEYEDGTMRLTMAAEGTGAREPPRVVGVAVCVGEGACFGLFKGDWRESECVCVCVREREGGREGGRVCVCEEEWSICR